MLLNCAPYQIKSHMKILNMYNCQNLKGYKYVVVHGLIEMIFQNKIFGGNEGQLDFISHARESNMVLVGPMFVPLQSGLLEVLA